LGLLKHLGPASISKDVEDDVGVIDVEVAGKVAVFPAYNILIELLAWGFTLLEILDHFVDFLNICLSALIFERDDEVLLILIGLNSFVEESLEGKDNVSKENKIQWPEVFDSRQRKHPFHWGKIWFGSARWSF
jgi:hypothetical protein